MGLKIKCNDDRIRASAAALLLLARAKLGRGDFGGLVSGALADYREDTDAFKEAFPKRDLAAAKDLADLVEVVKDGRRREVYQELLDAVDVVLARVERNRTEFSSLVELDNYWVASLRRFE
jgi:hypothetical protein